MANRVPNISDLIHRVASSCLTHRLPGGHGLENGEDEEEIETEEEQNVGQEEEEKDEDEDEERLRVWEEEKSSVDPGRVREMQSLTIEVFDAVSAVKRAYVSLQEAHCPWDPDKMRVADAAVVAELRRLGRLRDRFRRAYAVVGAGAGASSTAASPVAPLREAVAPYEAALDELKRELKVKEAEVEALKEKLKSPVLGSSGRRGRRNASNSKRVGCITTLGATAPELFEAYMEQVKSASKSFTAHLLSLMRSASWDIAATVRSILHAEGNNDGTVAADIELHHARYALESYVNRKLFHGFENETFYLEGSLASLLHPAEFRRDCFAQFRDMKGMDPAELLGVLPTCQFGKFAGNKYMAIVHQSMEESLFGGLEQRRQVAAGAHPRTGFYGEFLRLAKAVWLLHLLAFALDPPPSHFEASRGAEFHPEYMESVTRLAGGRGPPPGAVVGFSVGPGFKLGNGSVVRARVFLVTGGRGG